MDRNWINCYSIVTFVGGVVLVFSFSVTGLLLLSAMSIIGLIYLLVPLLTISLILAIPSWSCHRVIDV
ncbi:MAG: hypothetical protein WA631_01415, partial [Nitrososphaeraceae archaeon]